MNIECKCGYKTGPLPHEKFFEQLVNKNAIKHKKGAPFLKLGPPTHIFGKTSHNLPPRFQLGEENRNKFDTRFDEKTSMQ